MHKLIISLLLVVSLTKLQAQNMGIGTATPQAKLEISSQATSINPSLLLTDSTNKGFGILRFRSSDYPTKFIQLYGYKAQGPSAESYLYIGSDSTNIATFKGDGRVGINNGDPKERLDVDGNINLTGTIKANGVDGTANQVLMKDLNGTLGWGDVTSTGSSCNCYKNVAIFFATTSGANQSWLVPPGITNITVEIWGAGGTGGTHSGGGGGGYAKGNFVVDPGKAINFVIGLGGTPGGPQVAGQQTTVTIQGTVLHAYGGLQASESFADGYPMPAGGFYGITGTAFSNYIGVPGESGQPSSEFASQYSTTEFRRIAKVGNGGDAGHSSNTGATGGQTISLLPGGLFDATRPSPAQVPGGGGAAQSSSQGAAGLVVIHY
jgi:hypothetical protein